MDDVRQIPPAYCEYASGACDQEFSGIRSSKGLLLYPSEPQQLAFTIHAAATSLRQRDPGTRWLTWEDFKTSGQVIFCEICKNLRHTDVVIADVTTLNLNLLFEIGFVLGLEIPVVPVRDTSYQRDRSEFQELGLLDTIGYLDFQNSTGLADGVMKRLPVAPIPAPATQLNKQNPLYVMKGPIDTEGAVRVMSILKKANVRYRSYDHLETPRLSLHELRRQVGSSLGVIANLLDPNRKGAAVHNARAAMMAGLAMATRKVVLLVQEGSSPQPIDYRDVVQSYQHAGQLDRLLEPFIRAVIFRLQDEGLRTHKAPEGLLERLDVGDVAAENEIAGLRSYFIPTAQFNSAKRGHARLVVGRKGSGKTAVFYAVREAYSRRKSHLVLDLKPEGHQFTKLREAVLSRLSPGLQEHTLVAFWNYILLAEMANKIRDYEFSYAQRDEDRKAAFDDLMEVYESQVPADAGDFSERLLRRVDALVDVMPADIPETAGALTELLFKGDIRRLEEVLTVYLDEKEQVWVLVDNLDKGWPTRGASTEDILILRSLLEATRKLQRQMEKRGVELHCLVFLRNDIYDHLIHELSDRGKDTSIVLDWPDPEVFKQLVVERLRATDEFEGDFEEMWPQIFATHVGVQDSFS